MWGFCKCCHSSLAGVLSHRHKLSATACSGHTSVLRAAAEASCIYFLKLLIYWHCYVSSLFQETPYFGPPKAYYTCHKHIMKLIPGFMIIRWEDLIMSNSCKRVSAVPMKRFRFFSDLYTNFIRFWNCKYKVLESRLELHPRLWKSSYFLIVLLQFSSYLQL